MAISQRDVDVRSFPEAVERALLHPVSDVDLFPRYAASCAAVWVALGRTSEPSVVAKVIY